MVFSKNSRLIDSPTRLKLAFATIFIGLAISRTAHGQMRDKSLRSCIEVGKIIDVRKPLGSGDSYATISSMALGNPEVGGKNLTAFEENQSFVYAVGSVDRPNINM